MAYTLYVNSSGKLVTEDDKILPAQDRPELTAGVFYDFDVVPVAGAAAGTYTLSGDIKTDRRALMMQGTTSTVTEDGVIQFRNVSTDTLSFWDKPKSPGERFYLRITLADSGKSISILEDHIFCRPGIAGDDTTPPPANPGCVESVNGRTGNVVLTKSDVGLPNVQNILDNLNATAVPTATDDSSKGYSKCSRWIYAGKLYTCLDATVNAAIWTEGGGGDVTAAGDNTFGGANVFEQPLTVSGNAVDGLHCDDNPLDAYQAYDIDLRPYTWLDGTAASPTLTFKNYLMNLQEITFLAKSENAESSGNAVLVAKRPDGTEVERFTMAVTSTATLRTLPFDNFTGALEITRDTTDELDTLPGAVAIYALSTWRAK